MVLLACDFQTQRIQSLTCGVNEMDIWLQAIRRQRQFLWDLWSPHLPPDSAALLCFKRFEFLPEDHCLEYLPEPWLTYLNNNNRMEVVDSRLVCLFAMELFLCDVTDINIGFFEPALSDPQTRGIPLVAVVRMMEFLVNTPGFTSHLEDMRSNSIQEVLEQDLLDVDVRAIFEEYAPVLAQPIVEVFNSFSSLF
jgi:hypothetical protein